MKDASILSNQSKLIYSHGSFPTNPLIAEPLFLAGYIERMGTGIPDMVKACLDAGLKEPDFLQEESFKIILWRKEGSIQVVPDETPQDAPHDTPYDTPLVLKLLRSLSGEMSRRQLQSIMEIKDTKHFRESYLQPAIDQGLVSMTLNRVPTSRNQRYRLTEKGKAWQKIVISKKID